MDDPIDSLPSVGVLSLPPDHAEALQDVDDVVDAAAFHPELSRALIEQQEVLLLFPVDAEEPPAELTERLLLAVVLGVVGVEEAGVSYPVVEGQLARR